MPNYDFSMGSMEENKNKLIFDQSRLMKTFVVFL